MSGLVNPRSYSTNVSANPYYPVDIFKRYIKRYPTLFIAFKDQALWDNWDCKAVATACIQDVEDIFHEEYVLSTPYGMALFKGMGGVHVLSFC